MRNYDDICIDVYKRYLCFSESMNCFIDSMYLRTMIFLTNHNILTDEQLKVLNEIDKKLLEYYKKHEVIFNNFYHGLMIDKFFNMLEQAIKECNNELVGNTDNLEEKCK